MTKLDERLDQIEGQISFDSSATGLYASKLLEAVREVIDRKEKLCTRNPVQTFDCEFCKLTNKLESILLEPDSEEEKENEQVNSYEASDEQKQGYDELREDKGSY